MGNGRQSKNQIKKNIEIFLVKSILKGKDFFFHLIACCLFSRVQNLWQIYISLLLCVCPLECVSILYFIYDIPSNNAFAGLLEAMNARSCEGIKPSSAAGLPGKF